MGKLFTPSPEQKQSSGVFGDLFGSNTIGGGSYSGGYSGGHGSYGGGHGGGPMGSCFREGRKIIKYFSVCF